jgi:hypothetical protein
MLIATKLPYFIQYQAKLRGGQRCRISLPGEVVRTGCVESSRARKVALCPSGEIRGSDEAMSLKSLALGIAIVLAPCPLLAAPPAEGAAPAAPAGKKAWDDMSKDEKKDVMKKVVVPKMTALFKEFDAKKYGQVKCVLCHGEEAKKGKFGMPNPDLPKLDFANHLAKEREEKPKMVEFMAKKVVPEMATILGEQPFDPKTGKGFGCKACHTEKK